MAGLLLGCVALRSGLSGSPLLHCATKGALQGQEAHLHQQLQRTASAFVVAAACDLAPAAELVTAHSSGVQMAVSNPPRTYNHTRRLTVPAYCLAGTRTRRRRSRGGSGGDDDELGGGGGDDGFWGGGNDGNGGDDFWGSGDEGSGNDDGASLAARLQDLVLLWSVFCALAFAQTVWHVSPKPKGLASPAFAALSYSGLKAQLLRRSGPGAHAVAA